MCAGRRRHLRLVSFSIIHFFFLSSSPRFLVFFLLLFQSLPNEETQTSPGFVDGPAGKKNRQTRNPPSTDANLIYWLGEDYYNGADERIALKGVAYSFIQTWTGKRVKVLRVKQETGRLGNGPPFHDSLE